MISDEYIAGTSNIIIIILIFDDQAIIADTETNERVIFIIFLWEKLRRF